MRNTEVRDSRIGSLIAEEVELILSGATDSRISDLRVLSVEAQKGGKLFTLILGPEIDSELAYPSKEIQDSLIKATAWVRSELSGSLNLKKVPNLKLLLDPRYG